MMRNKREKDAYDAWHAPLRKGKGLAITTGLLIALVSVGGFAYWTWHAPIASAVVAQGSIVATGTNKIVQHLEGGIIQRIDVVEGQRIEPGDVLIELDRSRAEVDLRRLQLQQLELIATIARVFAERTLRTDVDYSPVLTAAGSDEAATSIISAHREIFETTKRQRANQRAILDARISAVREELSGVETRRTVSLRQLELIRDELSGISQLADKGLARRPQLLQLQRAESQMEGELGALTAQIGQLRQRILETENSILSLDAEYMQRAAEDARKARAALDDVEQRLQAVRDQIARLDIVAPVRGIVVRLNHQTPGGIIAPGQPILEIVPTDAELVVEARVRPTDIDEVRLGQPARLRLSALNQRTTSMLEGEVVYVSADAVSESRTGELHYVARIRPKALAENAATPSGIGPGMPVEVFLVGGEHTFLDYLLKPVLDSMRRAFREA